MTTALIVLALVISVAIGYKTSINTGLVAIVFAYLIGTFVLKQPPSDVIGHWPLTVFFVIFAVTLFFSIALENGTLEKISNRFIFGARSFTWALAFVFLFTAVLLAALGAGFYAVMVFVCPAALVICKQAGIDPLVGGIAVVAGAQAGSNFMISLNGVIFQGLFKSDGYSDRDAFVFSMAIFVAYVVMSTLVILGYTIYHLRARRAKGTATVALDLKKPEPFTPVQKKTLGFMGVFLLVVLLPPVFHLFLPDLGWLKTLNSDLDVGLVAVVFAVVGMMFNLAAPKKVLDRIPWSTLIMVSGVGMLVGVGIEAGVVDNIANWLGSGAVSGWLVPLLLAVVAAIITAFSSFIGVTAPALFPIVPAVSALAGLNPILLFIAITIGGLSTGISPYSSAGAMVLGFSAEEDRPMMFRRQLRIGLPSMVGTALLSTLVLTPIIG